VHLNQVAAGGYGLGHETKPLDSRQCGRGDQRLAAPGRPRHGVGENDRLRRPAADPPRLVDHPGQDGGDGVRQRHLGVPQQQRAVVDAPLRMRLEAIRPRRSRVDGVTADQQAATRLCANRRGHHRGAIEQQRSRPPA
jgi:hypothetical protein